MRNALKIACLVLCAFAGSAKAGISYAYFVKPSSGIQYDIVGNAVLIRDVVPGQLVPVAVWLRETVAGDDESQIDAAAGGLFGVGVGISQLNAPISPSIVAAESDIVGNLDIAPDPGITLVPPAVVNVIGISDPGYVGIDRGGGVTEVYIGTFTFTAGAEGTTQFRAARTDPNSTDTITFNFVILDDLIAAADFSIAVVPEPTTLLLSALGGVLLARRSPRISR